MKRQKQWLGGLAALAFVGAMSAQAFAGTVDVTKANGDFIAGTGIPANNFTGDTNVASGASVWLKARGRDTGQALGVVGTTYYVESGSAISNPASSWWVFDYQFSAGLNATPTTDYRLVLEFDKDPTAGTNWVVFDGNVFTGTSLFGGDWSDTDGYKVNPGSGAWSNDTTPYVISQSWRPTFSFIDPLFDRNIAGTYDIRLTAYSADGQTRLAGTAITVEVGVVPLPSSALMGLGLLGGLGALSWHRRRKNAALAA